jgi:hypothetical protein
MVKTQGKLDKYIRVSYLFHFTVDKNGQQADQQSLLTIYASTNVKVASFLVAGEFLLVK